MSLEDYNRLSPMNLFDEKRFKRNFSSSKPKPKKSDYDKGEFRRHFVIRKNTKFAVEVDSSNKAKAEKNPLYVSVKISWILSGPRNDVYNDGMLIRHGVEEKNLKTIETLKKEGILNVTDLIQDPLEYWRGY